MFTLREQLVKMKPAGLLSCLRSRFAAIAVLSNINKQLQGPGVNAVLLPNFILLWMACCTGKPDIALCMMELSWHAPVIELFANNLRTLLFDFKFLQYWFSMCNLRFK